MLFDRLSRQQRTAATALALFVAVGAVPFLATIDARLDTMLVAWRGCVGETLATLVSDLVGPVGVGVLVAVVLRSIWLGRPGPVEIVRVLVTLGVGVVLVGELKEFISRPRPGAEFPGPQGASFPSGHVGNTVLLGIAVLALWYGGAPTRPARRSWILLAVIAMTVGAARVYGRRHWPSDVIGTAALAVAYGLVAMLHPDRRWRTGVTAAAFVGIGLLYVAHRNGIRVAIPAGTVASRREPVMRIDFDSAYATGLLRGTWSLDQSDGQHHGAWLRAPTGRLELGSVSAPVSEIRLVVRPRIAGEKGAPSCGRLRVTLNDRVLGERMLASGWQSHAFSTTPTDFLPDGNILTVEVRNEPVDTSGAGERRAVFRDLALHTATPPAGGRAMPAQH